MSRTAARPCDSDAMASIGHVAIGMAAGRRLALRSRRKRTFALMFLFSLLSLLPDVDVVGFAMGVPYGAPFGHRGAAHSLAVAAALGLLAAVAASARRASDPGALVRAIRFGACVALVVASHGLLDAMTDGGKGVALLWPFTTRRFFFPCRPILRRSYRCSVLVNTWHARCGRRVDRVRAGPRVRTPRASSAKASED